MLDIADVNFGISVFLLVINRWLSVSLSLDLSRGFGGQMHHRLVLVLWGRESHNHRWLNVSRGGCVWVWSGSKWLSGIVLHHQGSWCRSSLLRWYVNIGRDGCYGSLWLRERNRRIVGLLGKNRLLSRRIRDLTRVGVLLWLLTAWIIYT